MLAPLCERSLLWWVNEAGIVLEIVGAAVIVFAAFNSRAQIRNVEHTLGGDLSIKLRNMIADQAFTELKGFESVSSRPCWAIHRRVPVRGHHFAEGWTPTHPKDTKSTRECSGCPGSDLYVHLESVACLLVV